MKTVLALLFTALLLNASAASWTWQDALVPDLGFDLDAAKVIRVTSLASKGKGSLRAALWEKGPRIIVFEVGGVIDLEMKSLEVSEPQVVIAGQTAPGPGITLIRGGLTIEASQCLLQHLAVRPGDAGQPKKSGWQPDGITTSGGPVDVWIDHCSATWGCDENISASTYKSPTGAPTQRVFIRDCIIAEGLRNATHEKGEHSKGTLVFDGTKEVAIVRCLYSSNTERNPVFKLDTSGVVVNCVMSNPGQRALHAALPGSEGLDLPKARISVVGNLVLFGE
ncbi:MAG: right-handed parallel beta-helix repeat-containing protein, partial [Roseimicrobium sp.]